MKTSCVPVSVPGVQAGRRYLLEESGLGLQETEFVNPLGRHGFDDVLRDAGGDLWIAEYKGGMGGALAEGQMGERWVSDVISRMREAAKWDPLAQELEAAFITGNLRGITLSTPGPNMPTVVLKLRAYNIGM